MAEQIPEQARQLQTALTLAAVRAGMAVFVLPERPWHGEGEPAMAVLAMDAPSELWPSAGSAGDDMASGQGSWS